MVMKMTKDNAVKYLHQLGAIAFAINGYTNYKRGGYEVKQDYEYQRVCRAYKLLIKRLQRGIQDLLTGTAPLPYVVIDKRITYEDMIRKVLDPANKMYTKQRPMKALPTHKNGEK